MMRYSHVSRRKQLNHQEKSDKHDNHNLHPTQKPHWTSVCVKSTTNFLLKPENKNYMWHSKASAFLRYRKEEVERKPSKSISVFIRLESFNPTEQNRDMHFPSADKPIFHFLVYFPFSFKGTQQTFKHYLPISIKKLPVWPSSRCAMAKHSINFTRLPSLHIDMLLRHILYPVLPSYTHPQPLVYHKKDKGPLSILDESKKCIHFLCRLMRNEDWSRNIGNFRLLIF